MSLKRDKKNHFPKSERSLEQRSLGKPPDNQTGVLLCYGYVIVQSTDPKSLVHTVFISSLLNLCSPFHMTAPSSPTLQWPPAALRKGGKSKGEAKQLNIIKVNQHSWILAVLMADIQNRLRLVEPFAGIWQNWAQISVLRMPLWALKAAVERGGRAKPAQQLTPLGSSYYWCWRGGKEDCKTRFL